MQMPPLRFAALLRAFFLFYTSSSLFASSAIIDGILTKVSNDRIAIRTAHTPYSSISSASNMMTHKDGSYQLRWENLPEFFTYYIDEIPVTQEQMRAFLKPGMQVCMMENRKREYFLYVSARGMGNQLGHLKQIEGNVLTLDREQKGWDKDSGVHVREGGKASNEKGEVILSKEFYPNRETQIPLDDNAVVLHQGVTRPWREADLKPDSGHARSRNSFIVQPKREHMRVELMPPGWGDWQALVTDLDTGSGWDGREIRHQYLAVATSDQLEQKDVNIRGPEAMKKLGEEKLKKLWGFASYRLAGEWNGKTEREMWTPIYSKGQSVIVDGFYTTYISHWEQGFVKPGRIMVCFQRRARITPDRFALSSESPSVWGIIREVSGDQLVVETPAIPGIPNSGMHNVTVEPDATYFHLGQPIGKEGVLQVGSLIKVYPKRPQTIVMNGG